MKCKMLLSVLVLVTMLLAACAAPTPVVVKEEVVVEKEVPVTVEVEKEVLVEKEVIQTVEVEKEVVVEKVVTATPVPGPTGEIIELSGIDPNTLDPYQMTTTNPEGNIGGHIFDQLIWRNANLELEPMLATSWELIDDLTWEFKLRDDVTFHNGEHFTAEAVQFSLERARDLEEAVDTTPYDIFYESSEIIDDYTIRIHTSEPAARMIHALSYFDILAPQYYAETPLEVAADNPVGSGPYKFVSWVRDGPLVIEANEDYWGGAPAIKTITVRAVPEAGARIAELEAGTADLITNVPPDQTDLVETALSRLEAVQGLRRIFIYIYSGDETKPWADKRVRQAMNYAVDVNTIGETLFAGYAERYGSWIVPPNNNPDLKPYPYDPDKARELLAEAGYPDGFDIKLHTPVGRYNKDKEASEAIGAYLTEVGIRAEVIPMDWATYVQEMLVPRQDLEIGLIGLSSGANDLEDAQNLDKDWTLSITDWYNEEYQALYAEASKTLDDAKRQELLFRAQEIAYDECPWIWLWRQYDFYGVNKRLQWTARSDEFIDFRDATLVE
jgi:peptide/nickel transport system substrate-binding protein